MIRMNHQGSHMDTPEMTDAKMPGNVEEVVSHVKKVKAQGAGIISMKLVGEGSSPPPKTARLRSTSPLESPAFTRSRSATRIQLR